MSNIFCTKCGLRAISKCPNHRSVFASAPIEVEIFEMVTRVKKVDEVGNDGTSKFETTITTYSANTHDEALRGAIEACRRLTDEMVEVAVCIHDWDFAPGERSSIGCGCESGSTEMPPDPFPKAE